MRVALFTHRFLEPTHYAIAQTMDAMRQADYLVMARWFGNLPEGIGAQNVSRRRLLGAARCDRHALRDVDLVHAIYDGDSTFDAVEMAKTSKLPIVLSFHGGFDTNCKIFDERYRARTLDACEQATCITVVGETDRRRLGTLGVVNDVTVLPVPIDSSILPRTAETDPFRIIAIGRMVHKKGLDVAVQTLLRLPAPYTLVVVGDGPLRESLEQLALRLGVQERITWTGQLPLKNTLELLAGSAVVLHPARIAADGNAEGTPQVILWAQALGVPVVTTRTGSIADVITDGQSGLLRDLDAAALAAGVIRVTQNEQLRRHVIDGGRNRVRSHDVGAVAGTLSSLYEKATRCARPPSLLKLTPSTAATRSALQSAAESLDFDPVDCWLAGKGGHGHVYVALSRDGRPIAVKVPAFGDHPSERWAVLQHKLLREWMVLTEAAGVGLPQGLAVGQDGRFLARSFLVGETLSRTVRHASAHARADLTLRAMLLGRTLLRRFHTHNRGTFLIRDFKPQNIVVPLAHPSDLQLVDVGAVLDRREVRNRTWDQVRLGTGQWLHWPPEQLLGNTEEIDTPTDYFALGVTAYYCLSGEFPYTNRCLTPSGVMARYRDEYEGVTAALDDLSAHSVSPAVTRAIALCLQPAVDKRLADPELLDALDLAPTLSAGEIFGLDVTGDQAPTPFA